MIATSAAIRAGGKQGQAATKDAKREGTVVVTPVVEAAWGEKARKEFLDAHPLADDGNLFDRVGEIGRKLVRVCDRPDMEYRFYVIKGTQLQAYSFPGGTIFLTESLARLYQNSDQLAFAIAHELSHIVLRHHIQQLSLQAMVEKGTPGEKALLEIVKNDLDRHSEVEADHFGALYAMRAGFKYTETYQSLVLLAKSFDGPSSDRAHPDFATRIEDLKGFRSELDRSVAAFQEGLAALASGDVKTAIDDLGLFVSQFPSSIAGHVDLGIAYLARLRRRSGTPAGLAEALPILSDPGVSLRGPLDSVDLGLARAQFEKALELSTEDALARAGLALIVLRQNDVDASRHHLELALTARPESPELLLCSGNTEFVAEKFPAALAFYQRALIARPGWTYALKNAAMTYLKMGDKAHACQTWAELVDDKNFATQAREQVQLLSCASLGPNSP